MTNEKARPASQLVHTWVPFSMALVSFVISIYTFFVTTRAPVVEVILPQQIRIAQGKDFGYAYLYLQPTLVSSGRSQQIEVIRDLTLDLAPAAGGERARFTWRESGRIAYDPETRQTAYVYESDATPLLLSRETAQSPLATFYGPDGWYFGAGEWHGLLTATLVGDRPPLQTKFRVNLSEDDVATMNAGGGRVYITTQLQDDP